MLILLRFLFIRKDEKPNDINEHGVKSDRLLGHRRRQPGAAKAKDVRLMPLHGAGRSDLRPRVASGLALAAVSAMEQELRVLMSAEQFL